MAIENEHLHNRVLLWPEGSFHGADVLTSCVAVTSKLEGSVSAILRFRFGKQACRGIVDNRTVVLSAKGALSKGSPASAQSSVKRSHSFATGCLWTTNADRGLIGTRLAGLAAATVEAGGSGQNAAGST